MVAPQIDVLIPAYNAAATLVSALSSITEQSAPDIRIIVVDDGSTDATPDLLAEAARADPRLLVLRQANGGIVSALNAGLARAAAPYLARFDSDDIAFPDRLERQRAYLEANRDCIAVGCDAAHIDEHGAPLSGLPKVGPVARVDPDWAPAREPYILHPFLMARRAAIMEIGGYRSCPQSEDSDLYWRLSERGRLHNLDETLGQYRVHQKSLSSLSIVNGRIMAVGSQLAAFSAQRRRTGRADIVFDATLAPALREAETLEAMCNVANARLQDGERPRFRLAVGAKLMELAHYRPYELDLRDCAFIRAALNPSLVSAENWGELRWHVTETARRLLKKGEAGKAFALAPPAFYPRIAAKTLLG